MVLTYNEQLSHALVRHQIGLLQYSGHVRNRIWKLLDETERDVRHQIEDRLRRDAGQVATPARLERVQKLINVVSETRLSAWDGAKDAWFEEMNALAVAEPRFMDGILKTTFPVDLGVQLPTPARLKAIVTSKPFMGATLKEWADDIAKKDVARIGQSIKIGFLQGETTKQIASRIVGTVQLAGRGGATAITRANAQSITRTAVSAISSDARNEFYAENKELIAWLVFIATLDSRTTPTCRGFDGNKYKLGDEPDMPLHWGERSLLGPAIDDEVVGERPVRNFTERQLLREFAEKEGLETVPKKRDAIPHGLKGEYDKFKRRRMRELTGAVPAKTTYQKFLEQQSPQFQDDILGPTRGKLFRDGGLTLDMFVTREGFELTLAQLAKMHAREFRAAGLDPAAFFAAA